MKYKYLSYPVEEGMPVYGSKAKIGLEQIKSIKKHDSSNVYRFKMENHWGTHVDAPKHFFENGKAINEYTPDYFVFNNPLVIDIELSPGDALKKEKWVEKVKPSTDIILFHSGWSFFRKNVKYVKDNPGIDPEVGLYLRKNYPKLKAIGIDWISVSPIKNRELGRQSHKAFLDPKGKNNPILLVEDMNLPENLSGLKFLIILPLRVTGVDSAPCTILGAFDD